MLEFSSVSVKKGNKVILDNVSLTVPNCSFTVLLGKNGSGKSTLLDTVIGNEQYSGKVILNGTDLRKLPPKERAKRLVCLPQRLSDSRITVQNLVSLGRYSSLGPMSVLDKSDKIKVKSALEITGICHLAEHRLDSLSGGERQKAYVAMTLASDADFLIFDEPTTYLDISSSREILNIIFSLVKDHGKTVLAVLHDLNSAVAVSDRICVLDGGKNVFEGTAAQFASSSVPKNIFGAECIKIAGRLFFT